jgi:hypothetical protein
LTNDLRQRIADYNEAGDKEQSVPPAEMRIALEWMKKGLNSAELRKLPLLPA